MIKVALASVVLGFPGALFQPLKMTSLFNQEVVVLKAPQLTALGSILLHPNQKDCNSLNLLTGTEIETKLTKWTGKTTQGCKIQTKTKGELTQIQYWIKASPSWVSITWSWKPKNASQDSEAKVIENTMSNLEVKPK